jgi:hypothetical protein
MRMLMRGWTGHEIEIETRLEGQRRGRGDPGRGDCTVRVRQ